MGISIIPIFLILITNFPVAIDFTSGTRQLVQRHIQVGPALVRIQLSQPIEFTGFPQDLTTGKAFLALFKSGLYK